MGNTGYQVDLHLNYALDIGCFRCTLGFRKLSLDLAHVRSLDVALVRGQGNRREDTNDGDDDHQFNERKTYCLWICKGHS